MSMYEWINRLPDDPGEGIVVVCYNDAMASFNRDLIRTIKGDDYPVEVISRANIKDLTAPGAIYYSPDLYDHIGNGAN